MFGSTATVAVNRTGLSGAIVFSSTRGEPIVLRSRSRTARTYASRTALSAASSHTAIAPYRWIATSSISFGALSREAHIHFLRAGQDGDSLRLDVPNDDVPQDGRIRRDVDYYVAFDDPRWINEQGAILEKIRAIVKEAGKK